MALRHMNGVPLPGALPGPQLIRQADVHGGSAWARWAMQESQPGRGHLLLPHASLRPEIMLWLRWNVAQSPKVLSDAVLAVLGE